MKRRNEIVILLIVVIIVFTILVLLMQIVALVVFILTGLGGYVGSRILRKHRESVEVGDTALRITRIAEVCSGVFRDMFPRFIQPQSEQRFTATVRKKALELDPDDEIDEAILEELINDYVGLCIIEDVRDRVGRSVLRNLGASRISPNLPGSEKELTSTIVKTFLSEQIMISDRGDVSLSDEGERFVRLQSHIEENGSVESLQRLAEAISRELDPDRVREALHRYTDPQMRFVMYDLAKGPDVLDLVKKEMSGERIRRGLDKMRARTVGDQKSDEYYVLLKQEPNQEPKRIFNGIRAFARWIAPIGMCRMHVDGDEKSYQSLNVVGSPTRYRSVKAFLESHFPEVLEQSDKELSSTCVLAIPLDIEKACLFPSDDGHLKPAIRETYRMWVRLFGLNRRAYKKVVFDFGITFTQILEFLTIDFLVEDLFPIEKDYFRHHTDAILQEIGVKDIVGLSRFSKEAIKMAIMEVGLPEYSRYELMSEIEETGSAMEEFAAHRLEELAGQIEANSRMLHRLKVA